MNDSIHMLATSPWHSLQCISSRNLLEKCLRGQLSTGWLKHFQETTCKIIMQVHLYAVSLQVFHITPIVTLKNATFVLKSGFV